MKRLFIIIISALVFLTCGCAVEKSQSEIMQESKEELRDLDLNVFIAEFLSDDDPLLRRDLKEDDLTIFYFWSTWSEASQSQLSKLEEYRKELPDNIRVITVCVDGLKHKKTAKSILKKADYSGRTIIAADRDMGILMETVKCLPTTLFFDSEGIQQGEPVIGIIDDFELTMDKSIRKILHVGKVRIEKDKKEEAEEETTQVTEEDTEAEKEEETYEETDQESEEESDGESDGESDQGSDEESDWESEEDYE